MTQDFHIVNKSINFSIGIFLGFGTPFFALNFILFQNWGKDCQPTLIERHVSPNGRLVATGEIWACKKDRDQRPEYQLRMAMRSGEQQALIYAARIDSQSSQSVPKFRWMTDDNIHLFTKGNNALVGPRIAWCEVRIQGFVQ